MKFIEKVKAGFEQGIKAKVSHPVNVSRAEKDVYKSSKKWEKDKAKAEKKAAKKAKKAAEKNSAYK